LTTSLTSGAAILKAKGGAGVFKLTGITLFVNVITIQFTVAATTAAVGGSTDAAIIQRRCRTTTYAQAEAGIGLWRASGIKCSSDGFI